MFTNSQKGFAPLIILALVSGLGLLFASGYYLGKISTLTSPKQQTFPSPQSTNPSASSSPNNPNLKPNPTSSTNPTPSSSPANITTSPTYTQSISSPSNNIINALGGYSYAGQTVNYSVSFPRLGGNVTGTISGACTGNISGRFLGGDGANIKGSTAGTCQVGFIKQNFSANYDGTVYLYDGRIDLTWNGNIPFYSGTGSFSLFFPPQR